jgi:hypothetical protein
MKITLTMQMPPNLRAELNLERKHSQLGLHTWHFHQLQEVLKSKRIQ